MEPTSPDLLNLHAVSHSYRSRVTEEPAVRDVELRLAAGSSLALLGPSGCGKSTLLQIAAGLIRPQTGQVLFKGSEHHRPDKRISLMLQQYGLFPWKTVRGNLELAMRLQGRQVDEAALQAALSELGIAAKLNEYPGQLSGGQQQRVALARSLLMEAELLLLDEPFGALDSITRERLQDLLRGLWQGRGMGMLVVTHNMQEAVMLGERIIVMGGTPGRVVAEIDNLQMRDPQFRDSGAYIAVLERLRHELGVQA